MSAPECSCREHDTDLESTKKKISITVHEFCNGM
jgi:hypothetical protein